MKNLTHCKSTFIILFLLIIFNTNTFADNFTEGETYFKDNRPNEAIPLLENALLSDTIQPNLYIYLGLAYYQVGKFQKSLDTFILGTQRSDTNKKVLYYNAGNTAFAMENFTEADQYYSLACVASPSFSQAVLNRANTRMKLDNLLDAKTDYASYLSLEPNSPQKQEILQVIDLIDQEIVLREEQARLKALEEERLKAEQERIAEELEKQRIAKEQQEALDAERRKKMLEDIAASLQSADSTNMSAGTDGVMEYEYDAELD